MSEVKQRSWPVSGGSQHAQMARPSGTRGAWHVARALGQMKIAKERECDRFFCFTIKEKVGETADRKGGKGRSDGGHQRGIFGASARQDHVANWLGKEAPILARNAACGETHCRGDDVITGCVQEPAPCYKPMDELGRKKLASRALGWFDCKIRMLQ